MVYSIQQTRALAAVLVVMTHVFEDLRPIAGSQMILVFQEVNIIFTFAAGFLFQLLSINELFGSFIARRFRNVLVPYVLISIPAILVYTIGGKLHPYVDLHSIPQWLLPLYLLATGLHLGPLWFVPMIFILYLLTPLIRHIDRSNIAYLVVIPVSLALSFTLFPRPEFNQMPPLAAAHYLPIFLIGMFCSRHNDAITRFARKYWLPMLILFASLAFASAQIDRAYQYPVKIAMLMSLFVVASRTAEFRSPVIDAVATNSFGIFLLHGYFVSALHIAEATGKFGINETGINLVLITFAICLACLIVIWIAKRIFGKRSRMIVGA